MEITCRHCDKTEEVKHEYTRYYNRVAHPNHPIKHSVYRNDRGFSWYGQECPGCRRARIRNRKGQLARIECLSPTIAKGNEVERQAARFFRSLGFTVERGHGQGLDLYCTIGSWEYSVEVKQSECCSKNYWRTNAVQPRRRNDDLIAIRLPNGRIYIDDMKIHQSKCTTSGRRNISNLVREFGLGPLPQS